MIRIKSIHHSLMITGLCLSLLAGSPAVSLAAGDNTGSETTAEDILTAPDSCTVSVSAQALSDTEVSVQVTLSCKGGSAQINLLSITLPGQSEQILKLSGSTCTFTTGADLEGSSVSYIPGTDAAGGDTWFDSLEGSFTIPVVHTAPEEDAEPESSTGNETSDPDSSSDPSENASADTVSDTASDTASGTASDADPDTSAAESAGTESSDDSTVSSSETSSSSAETADSTSSSGSSGSSKSSTKKKSRRSSSGSSSSSGSGTSSRSHSGSSSGHKSGSGSTSHSGSSGSRSSGSTKSEETSETADSVQAVTETVSSLGKRLLKNGETLSSDEDSAPQLDGLTYEATWENEESGLRLYLYEEGYAVLEVSSVSSGESRHPDSVSGESSDTAEDTAETDSAETGPSETNAVEASTAAIDSAETDSGKTRSRTEKPSGSKKTLQFLLLPEQTEESSLASILESWAQ